jgi:uncharacterized protein (TIGR00730 family)
MPNPPQRPDHTPRPDNTDRPDPLTRAPLAYENEDFIDSPDGRLIRIMAEYQEPLVRFRRERIADTVVFFGSARFHAARSEAENQADPHYVAPTTDAERAAAAETAAYYEDARNLAHLVSTWAMSIPGPRHRFVITSGGGPGIMEAANRGAWEAGAKTIGLNIKLPFEQTPNPWITPALNFEFHYFFMRKFWFAYLAKALVVFPGGFGTMDEMFEVLTLAQTNKLENRMAVILFGSDYWKSVVNFETLAAKGAIAPGDMDLVQFADTPEQAFELLKTALTPFIHLPGKLTDGHTFTPATPSDQPLPTAQDLLGPDINKTRV